MDCTTARSAISAELDGEAPGASLDIAHGHVRRCRPCAAWQEAAESLHRRVRLHVADEVPDLTPAILAAIAADGDVRTYQRATARAARSLLAIVGATQVLAAAPDLAGLAATPVHLSHELGSWDLALGAGFLFAAFRPARAWGMLPLVGAIVTALMVTGFIDSSDGATALSGETAHVMELAGLGMLWQVSRTSPSADPRLRSATP